MSRVTLLNQVMAFFFLEQTQALKSAPSDLPTLSPKRGQKACLRHTSATVEKAMWWDLSERSPGKHAR